MSDLTIKQKRAIESLLTARTLEEAAKAAGINPRSLTRWMDDPAFRAELARQEGEAIQAATRRLTALADDAVAAVEDVLTGYAKPAARLRAAEMVLSNLLKLRELVGLEQRVPELERKAGK